MASLVDTSVLVYRVDPRDANKQRIAQEVLHQGVTTGQLVLAHQSIIEFVAVVTRPTRQGPALLDPGETARHVEELMTQFDVIYPNDQIVRLALRGAATYQLSWFDAHLWACAEHYGHERLLSEDLQHDRTYGTVRVVNPFAVA